MDFEELGYPEFYPEAGEGDGCICGGKYVKRFYKDKDTLEIKSFLGCSNYPRCERTIKIDYQIIND